jgi:hypothetical protein
MYSCMSGSIVFFLSCPIIHSTIAPTKHTLTTMPLIPFFFYFFSLVNLSIAGYVLKDDYNPSVFFDKFDFWTAADPTHGFVQYIDQNTAWKNGLITKSGSSVYIGVDHTNQAPNGRESIRLTSKASYNSGSLVILDLAHMPGSICGSWPAYWMVGPNWPNGGEIDIIEGVNSQNHNAMTLHTADGCSIYNNHNFTGTMYSDDCYVYAPDQGTNVGCQIYTPQTNTYGDGFNNVGGGVYAMEWTDEAITIWFFQRGSIPSNIQRGSPTPDSSWGRPLSQFTGCCDIPEFFSNNQIVFDVTFCGDWAGSAWGSDPTCAPLGGSCNNYVANNPSAFKNSYWSINSLRVYEQTIKSSVKVALPAFCNNDNNNIPTSTETFISTSTTLTETEPAAAAETTSIVSSTVSPTTETLSTTQSTLAVTPSSTAQTSSSFTSSRSRASSAAETSSKVRAKPTDKTSPALAPTAETAVVATRSTTRAPLLSTIDVVTTVTLAKYRDLTTTQWTTVVTTFQRVVSVTTPRADNPTPSTAAAAVPATRAQNSETTPTAQAIGRVETILTIYTEADRRDSTTTEWVTVTTNIVRTIDTVAAEADTTVTQWSTSTYMAEPDVFVTQWVTLTSTFIFQKARRTAVPSDSLMLKEEAQLAASLTTRIEAQPSPSRRWLPRHWGRARI